MEYLYDYSYIDETGDTSSVKTSNLSAKHDINQVQNLSVKAKQLKNRTSSSSCSLKVTDEKEIRSWHTGRYFERKCGQKEWKNVKEYDYGQNKGEVQTISIKQSFTPKTIEIPFTDYVDVPKITTVVRNVTTEKVDVIFKPVDQFIDVFHKKKIDVEKITDVNRKVPKPLELVEQIIFTLPMIKPQFQYEVKKVCVPRFIDVPIPTDAIHQNVAIRAESCSQVVNELSKKPSSLCEIENAAAFIRGSQIDSYFSDKYDSYARAVYHNWNEDILGKFVKSDDLDVENNLDCIKIVQGRNLTSENDISFHNSSSSESTPRGLGNPDDTDGTNTSEESFPETPQIPGHYHTVSSLDNEPSPVDLANKMKIIRRGLRTWQAPRI